jgi:hypothetical protein
VDLEFGLQLVDAPLGGGEFLALDRRQPGDQPPVDGLLATPGVDRLVADPQVTREVGDLLDLRRAGRVHDGGTPAGIPVFPWLPPIGGTAA